LHRVKKSQKYTLNTTSQYVTVVDTKLETTNERLAACIEYTSRQTDRQTGGQ